MGDVIDIRDAKNYKNPHLAGKARCLACKHEWEAVAPLGTIWMECPNCSLMRGRYVNQAQTDLPHWHCNCGNELFYITKEFIYCCNCGLNQEIRK